MTLLFPMTLHLSPSRDLGESQVPHSRVHYITNVLALNPGEGGMSLAVQIRGRMV